MKPTKLLLILLLPLIFWQEVKGQGYIPLVGIGKTWSTMFTRIDQSDTYWTKFTNDTIIFGKAYKKVITSWDSTFLNKEITGYIREDSIGRIFFMNTLFEEGLIYDFSANIGDTLIIHNKIGSPSILSQFSDCYEETVVVVDSIFFSKDITIYNLCNGTHGNSSYQTHFIDDIYRKIIVVKKLNSEYRDKWIEGIGSIAGVMESGSRFICNPFCFLFVENTLLCYKENDIIIYKDAIYSTCHRFSVNINEITNCFFQVYPNPTIDNCFTISFNNMFEGNITLYNLIGKPIFEKNVSHPITQTNICLSESEKGFFLIIIQNIKNEVASQKIIIN